MHIGVLLGVLCIVGANAVAPRLHIAAPLILVATGVAVSLQPWIHVGGVTIDPEIILGGVLPLLLFAAAVSMPAVSFRRNFKAISSLSVTLVVITSFALGALFSHVLPDLGFAAGVALGAVLSPTDAVATSIVKRLGVAPRLVDVLDGEAMLNDASALVILRTALVAVAASTAGHTSIGGAVGKFFLSVLIATAIGVAVGWATLYIRKRIKQATVNTLLSFAVPLIAFQPAEHAGASGLVAVVAAGLVIGHAAPRFLAPGHRANERINWHTIEMLLEGGLFLIMGLQLVTLLDEEGAQIGLAFSLAAAALGISLGVRAIYTIPLLRHERKAHRRYEAARGKLEDMRDGLVQTEAAKRVLDDRENKVVARLRNRVRRVLADADYLAARPLGWRDAILLVWAGMRGAITLAAAQTLPADFPHRSLLVLVAFLVATGSLLIQGSTLAWVVRRLHFATSSTTDDHKEREALTTVVISTGMSVVDSPTARSSYGDLICDNMKERLSNMRNSEEMEHAGHLVDEIFDAQRSFILDARSDGSYSTETLAIALRRVDAMQLGMSMSRRGRIGDEE